MSTTQSVHPATSLSVEARSRERSFYTAYAWAGVVAVFIGFGRTYYLRGFTDASPLSALVHVHAVIFSLWILFFAVQTSLVAARRVAMHRSLGYASIALAAAVVGTGLVVSLAGARDGWMGPQLTRDPEGGLQFLVVPLGDMVLFSALYAGALYYRRVPDVHKRVMVLVMCGVMMPASFFRLPLPLAFAFLILFLLAGPVYDRLSRGRIHPVYKWGVPAVFASALLRPVLGQTEVWRTFAVWLLTITGFR